MPTLTAKPFYLLAFLFCGLALGPALAHLFALPNKIGMEQAEYFTAQQVYRGWALLGIVVLGALLSTLGLTVALRHQRAPMTWALIACLCIVGTQLLFWTFTFPGNQATANWTQVPADWAALRRQWEYSHAASAVLNLAALMALVLSVLSWNDAARRRRG